MTDTGCSATGMTDASSSQRVAGQLRDKSSRRRKSAVDALATPADKDGGVIQITKRPVTRLASPFRSGALPARTSPPRDCCRRMRASWAVPDEQVSAWRPSNDVNQAGRRHGACPTVTRRQARVPSRRRAAPTRPRLTSIRQKTVSFGSRMSVKSTITAAMPTSWTVLLRHALEQSLICR